jgi:hypothetical protein
MRESEDMAEDTLLREHLIKLLTGGEAHVEFKKAVAGLPTHLRGKIPDSAEHSPWQLVEHLRIAQRDILDFSRDPNYVAPNWPDDYWPREAAPENDAVWEESVQAFQRDREALCELISNPATDLYAKIPWGDGQTILREALLTADHNAYHVGQLVTVRRLLGAW